MRTLSFSLVSVLTLTHVFACSGDDDNGKDNDPDASVDASTGGEGGSGGSSAGGSPSSGGAQNTGGGVPDAGADAPSATGTVTVTVNLQDGVDAAIVVAGPGGSFDVTESTSLALAPGEYTVDARTVREAGTFVDTLWIGVASSSTVEVEAGATAAVTVTYERRPGTGHIWVANANESTLVAYSDATLAGNGGDAGADAGASRSPDIVLSNPLGDGGPTWHLSYPAGLAFDAFGHLWVANCDDTVVVYSRGNLGESGAPTPDAVLDIGRCALDLAFDEEGRLAVASNPVLVYTESERVSNGTPITLGSGLVISPNGITFDANGNLWVADYNGGTVYRWDAADIGSSLPDGGEPPPSRTWTNLGGPAAVTFDAQGNLWITNFDENEFLRVAPADVDGADLVVSLRLSGAGATLGPETPAFDGAGNLWVSDWSGGKLVRVPSAELAQSGNPDGGSVAITTFVTIDDGLSQPYKTALNPPPSNVPIFTPP